MNTLLKSKIPKTKNVKTIDPLILSINNRIKKEICYNTLLELTDEKLLPIYKECKSVKNAVQILENTLDKYVEVEIKQKIINDYLLKLIPAGTKGVYRGNKFNEIVKNHIINLNLDPEKFEVSFEKYCHIEKYITSEKPDWYILEKSTEKIIIGMNQLDLWGGGQQTNRGSKYIENAQHNNEKSKLLCVVCNDIIISSKNKTYNLFEIGFRNNTLCYLNNLENIIMSYFYFYYIFKDIN